MVLTLETVVQVFVADDNGSETMTPVGVTVPPVVADTFNDIVMGCDKPGNDTCRITDRILIYFNLYHIVR